MNAISTRTTDVIAAEINGIKAQTRTMLLCSSIEIGRRLVEAKSMVEHGQWGEWLEKQIDYSPRTAQNLMKIFEEYGADQLPLFGDNAKTQALADLTYTQAVALLGVPAEDREKFIAENKVDEMTTRELQQAIKERDLLSSTLDKTKTAFQNATAEIDSLKTVRQQMKKEIDRLVTELHDAKAAGTSQEKLDELAAQLQEAQGQIVTLNEELSRPVTVSPAVVEKVPEAIEQELAELRKKAAAAGPVVNPAILKFGVHFDALVAGFGALLEDLAAIGESDPAAHPKYRAAVSGLLNKMAEKL